MASDQNFEPTHEEYKRNKDEVNHMNHSF